MTTILTNARTQVLDDASDKLSKAENSSVLTSSPDIPPLGEPSTQSSSRGTFFASWNRKMNLEAIATQPSVFDDPVTLEIYRPPPQYENVHRFDPLFRWKWKEEMVRGDSWLQYDTDITS